MEETLMFKTKFDHSLIVKFIYEKNERVDLYTKNLRLDNFLIEHKNFAFSFLNQVSSGHYCTEFSHFPSHY
jgi:hypothetical protein